MTSLPSGSAASRFSALGVEQRIRLMRRLVQSGRTDKVPAVVPPRDDDGPVRLSPAQEDLWVYESLHPHTAALNLCSAYHFDEPVDPEELSAAITLLQNNHDILRSRVFGDPGDPGSLRVDFPPADPFELERLDLRATGRALDDVFTELRSRTFDLSGGDRLIRGWFVTVDDEHAALLLSLHHMITDWWSFDVLHTEFADAYRAVREGGTPPGRPDIQYADFASWQRELEAAGVLDARLDFWQRYLVDPPAPLTVPGAGGAGDEFGIAQLPFHVDRATEQAVRALARRHGTTVYGVLISAFAAFAARLTRADDLLLGTPVANRAAKGLERLIGYVMNAVPTRWRIAPGDTFTDLIGRFAADFPQVLAHADAPLGRIVARTAPGRTAGRSPLFQWVFMYLPQQQSERRLREFTEPERVLTGGEYDLVGVMQDADDGFSGTLEVRTDTYDPASVRHWADGFVTMLRRLVAAPDTPIEAYAPLTEEDRQRLLRGAGDGPAPVSLPELVERQADRTPHAPALEAGEEVLTYGELAERVARLAGRLAELGVGPGEIVALALGRGSEATVAALAVQRAGAAYLPLDPDHPADRLSHVLTDARPVLLVTAPGAATPYTPDGLSVLEVDEKAFSAVPPPSRTPAPNAAAYVIYTSGSTGRPKGVVVPHTGISALAQGVAERFGLTRDSRVLQVGSPSFDISVSEAAMAFHAGATLVVAPPGPCAGESLGELLRELRITAVLLPPALLAGVPAGDYPELRTVGVGAEVCPPGLPARWAVGGRRVLNLYGPTEATVVSTVSDPLTGDGTPPPIGRPLPGTRAYVLDEALRPVPVGVRGELYAAGSGPADGYLGRPGLTAERFVPDPYGPPGVRMYRTGDLARVRPDGQLDFLGRADEQLKLNGLRLELGEIEAVLAEHTSLERAVVALREDTPGERRLVAYCVPRPGHRVDPQALRAHAASQLPAGMVPVSCVALDTVPLTPSGKTDRAALPAPQPQPAESRPVTPREAVLCELFAGVLGHEDVAADADLFELGGDSIMAIQLVGRARAAGLEFTPAEVFVARTPAGLAAAARIAGPGEGDAADDGVGLVPLTPIMHWWRDQGDPVNDFTMRALLRTPAGAGAERIETALRVLTERHGTLRMRVTTDGAGRVQGLEVPPVGVATDLLTRVDAARLDAAGVRAAAEDAGDALRLDPAAGRLLRAVWYDAGPGRAGWLLLNLHHFAVDGVSLRILGTELGELLAGRELAAGPRTSFRGWAELLHAQAGQREAELPRWEAELSRPGARLTSAAPSGRRATLTVVLPPDRTRPLVDDLPAAFHCGPDAVLLTALAVAAAHWRGTGGALLVDVEGHGREELLPDSGDLSGTVGWFTSQHPVLLDAGEPDAFRSGNESASRALRQVKEQMRAVPDAGLGWGLLRHLNPATARRLSVLPNPDVGFNYLGRISEGDLDLLDTGALPLGHVLELDVLTRERADGPHLVVGWSYADGVLGADEVRRLADLWSDALAVLAACARTKDAGGFTVSDFPLVDLTQGQLDMLQEGL
ncbi:amino acid adenylation domain-containing protein [Streptomyces iakyrus]|uniref:amino acid adenylation domain-containing protein n=1 Tax=Streptomyces iakyrus TaxID=68219 RepID=UPI0036EE7B12